MSSVLDASSNNGPSTDDVLFNEDLSLAIRLEPKIASKSTFETLSLETTSGPKVRPDLRCMYVTEVRIYLSLAINVFRLSLCSDCYCQIVQF